MQRRENENTLLPQTPSIPGYDLEVIIGLRAFAAELARERLAASETAVWRKVSHWRNPTHRSRADWDEEFRHVLRAEAWKTLSNLSLAPGIDFDAFVYQRILAGALTYYRAELRHSERFLSYSPADFETDDGQAILPMPRQEIPNPLHESVREKLAFLTEAQRSLLELAFYEGRTQSEIAALLGLSQSKVNRLLKTALDGLRACLKR